MSGSSSSKKKKESEGIALLSMYYGEEEDEDMDDTLESMPGEEETQIEENMEEDEVILNGVHPPLDSVSIDNNTPPVSIHNSLPPSQQQQQQVFGSRKGIVDYGHDDTAFSPDADAEDGEVDCLLMFGADLQTVNGTPPGTVQVLTRSTQSTPPQSSEHVNQSQSEAMIYNITETPKEAIDITEDEENKMDLLDKFLPPPPNTKCSAELQEKIIKFLLLKKKTGRSFNSEVRNRKEYRNPDFLLHAVTYQDIDQIGSCFSKDVFDPHGYVKSDYYDEIEADLKRELERKEQEKKKSQKIDFLSGGTQTAIAVTTPKVMPIPAVPPVSAGVDIGTREGRLNKKSKWDKVDGDTRHPLTTGGQDSVSAANAGSGYTAFAQQRRKEAEERRSSERKVDRRS